MLQADERSRSGSKSSCRLFCTEGEELPGFGRRAAVRAVHSKHLELWGQLGPGAPARVYSGTLLFFVPGPFRQALF